MLKFLKKELILTLALLTGLSACAKIPEAPLSPSVKIAVEKSGDVNIFAVNFTFGLKNENSSTAFTDVAGLIEIKDNTGITVLSVPFKTAAILPFETGIIQEKISLSADQAAPLFNLLSIKKEHIESEEARGNIFIEERNVVMKDLQIKKTDIIELLRSKLK